MNIRLILFDFDGVFTNKFTSLSAQDLCRAWSVAPEQFAAAARASAVGLDTGEIDESEYLRRLSARLGVSADVQETLTFLARADKRHLKRNEQMYALLANIQKKGIEVALLSNVSEGLARRLSDSGLYDAFGRVFFSYDIGYAKPDPRAYLHALHALDRLAQETLCIDDQLVNTKAAEALGMHTMHHVDAAETTKALQTMLAG